MRPRTVRVTTIFITVLIPFIVWVSDPEVLRPRVPPEQMQPAEQVMSSCDPSAGHRGLGWSEGPG
jgi:hypothetical protein